jgi:hypothetical protein
MTKSTTDEFVDLAEKMMATFVELISELTRLADQQADAETINELLRRKRSLEKKLERVKQARRLKAIEGGKK